MTAEEFNAKESELLAQLPEEFRSAVSYNAYENGHSAGYEEVLLHVSDLVYLLKDPIEKYTKRIRSTY